MFNINKFGLWLLLGISTYVILALTNWSINMGDWGNISRFIFSFGGLVFGIKLLTAE
jgi:hypothetical protein